jgi:hypothetical protein
MRAFPGCPGILLHGLLPGDRVQRLVSLFLSNPLLSETLHIEVQLCPLILESNGSEIILLLTNSCLSIPFDPFH